MMMAPASAAKTPPIDPTSWTPAPVNGTAEPLAPPAEAVFDGAGRAPVAWTWPSEAWLTKG